MCCAQKQKEVNMDAKTSKTRQCGVASVVQHNHEKCFAELVCFVSMVLHL